MKKPIILISLLLSIFAGNAQTQKLTELSPTQSHPLYINGSEAMFPVIQDMVQKFNYQYQFGGHKNVNLEVKNLGQGSTLGIHSLIEGNTNLATSTRTLTQQEKDEFARNNMQVQEFCIAREALTIVVNPKSSVYALTFEQVAQIFSGQITNWKQVGGDDFPIKVFIRSNTSGCYEGFKQMFFKNGENYTETALQLGSNQAIKTNLEKFEGGISFLGYNSAAIKESGLRMIKISTDQGKTFVAPAQLTIDVMQCV